MGMFGQLPKCMISVPASFLAKKIWQIDVLKVGDPTNRPKAEWTGARIHAGKNHRYSMLSRATIKSRALRQAEELPNTPLTAQNSLPGNNAMNFTWPTRGVVFIPILL